MHLVKSRGGDECIHSQVRMSRQPLVQAEVHLHVVLCNSSMQYCVTNVLHALPDADAFSVMGEGRSFGYMLKIQQ